LKKTGTLKPNAIVGIPFGPIFPKLVLLDYEAGKGWCIPAHRAYGPSAGALSQVFITPGDFEGLKAYRGGRQDPPVPPLGTSADEQLGARMCIRPSRRAV
jgi:hypothetical protein